MPQDYVDYVQISRIDDLGVEHPLYPARHTSIPSESIGQANDGSYLYDDDDSLLTQTPEAQRRFKDANLNNGTDNDNNLNNIDSLNERITEFGQRYGIKIKYVSDGMGTDAEMKVHKFAEEAIYKHIVYSVMSTRKNAPEYVIQRYKRDRFAAMRNAKLRLSNLNPRELAQVMRNKSKRIKH